MKKFKFGIIISDGIGGTKNIGDYIQALAAIQFLPDGVKPILLDREHLDTFEIEEEQQVKTVMNAWFMTKPFNFPPSKYITPLFVSFHLTPKVESVFFKQDTIDYLQKYGPIGCRDTNTVLLMQKYGIDAYFSGCLTLTLGKSYNHKSVDSSSIYIVDPYCENIIDWDILTSIRQIFRVLFFSLFKKGIIRQISNQISKTTFKYFQKNARFIYAAKIYSTYCKVLSDEVLCSAIYEEHRIPQKLVPTDDLRFEYARNLLKKYESAKLVITSRIHCGLPCLGMGTPVLFAFSDKMERKFRPTRPNGRLGGLLDLFNCIDIRYGVGRMQISNKDKKQIQLGDVLTNKTLCLKYISELSQKLNSFINGN